MERVERIEYRRAYRCVLGTGVHVGPPYCVLGARLEVRLKNESSVRLM